jgi:light-regulated signal transduction histidine kinase (bacteriophytochrome)
MSSTTSQDSEVQRLQAELAQVRAEFQDFVYCVSHDLRAPLRHITAFTQVIEEDLPNPPADICAHLATIRQSAQLLALQLDGLTQLSRLGQQPLQIQPVNVLSLLSQVQQELQARQPERAVVWQLPSELPQVLADPALLRQVLEQVLDNALKFTVMRDAAQICVSWLPGAGAQARGQLLVSDNGVGFASAQQDKLFKVFGRLHLTREFAGLGLGLLRCRKALARMGAEIEIAAEPDQGCQVTLSLPLA